ncbi:MAG: hypothetical protein JNM36_17510 [Chitinophagales bacterium]|nr:hypothetical protein [Chitinophagales bacterium]
MQQISTIIVLLLLLTSCTHDKLEEKGFPVATNTNTSTTTNAENTTENNGLQSDSLRFETQPSNVLLTGLTNVRLISIYKVNTNRNDGTKFIGSNDFHYNDSELPKGNNWNNNLLPGLKAVYGYNLVNIAQFDIAKQQQKQFFSKPVLIKTVYYPTDTKDTLNYQPIKRDYCLVSVYDEDTNKDGFINLKDLRHFYLFDKNGEKQDTLVGTNYSVYKSEYDPDNDLLYAFARLDLDNNGQIDDTEPIHIFGINLKNPSKHFQLYKP